MFTELLTLVLTGVVTFAVAYFVYAIIQGTGKDGGRKRFKPVYDPLAGTDDEEEEIEEPAVCLNCGKTAIEAAEAAAAEAGQEDGADQNAEGNKTSDTASKPVPKLKRCSRCMTALYCGPECAKAAWPVHKLACNQVRKLDIVAFAPLFASVAHLARTLGVRLPNIDVDLMNKALHYKVLRKVMKESANELLLHLGPGPSERPLSLHELDGSGTPPTPPTGSHLHLAMVADGHVFASALGVMLAFHGALNLYNHENEGEKRIVLAHKGQRIKEYGLAVGRSKAPYGLVYRYPDGRIERRQSVKQHCWFYFTCEDGRTEVLVDFSNAPLGCPGTVVNALQYLPQEGTMRKLVSPARSSMLPCPLALHLDKNGPAAAGDSPGGPDATTATSSGGSSGASGKGPAGKKGAAASGDQKKQGGGAGSSAPYEQAFRVPIHEDVWDRTTHQHYQMYVEQTLQDYMVLLQEDSGAAGAAAEGAAAEDAAEGGDGASGGSKGSKGALPKENWLAALVFFACADETMRQSLKEEAFTKWATEGFLKDIATGNPAAQSLGR